MTQRTTEQPLKVVAVRLPQSLIDAAQRYADLYRSSVSELLREGLELRLQTRELPSMDEGQTALSPGTVAMLHTLATTLSTAAAAVRSVCQDGTAGEVYDSHTIQQGETSYGHTSRENLSYNGHTPREEETSYGDTALIGMDLTPDLLDAEDEQPRSLVARPQATAEQPLAVMRTAALAALREEPQPTTLDGPAYDASKYVLGKLCPRGHDYQGTGHSLRRLRDRNCLQCDAAKAQTHRDAAKVKRQAVGA